MRFGAIYPTAVSALSEAAASAEVFADIGANNKTAGIIRAIVKIMKFISGVYKAIADLFLGTTK